MTNLVWLVAAYTGFFALIFAYTVWMGKKQKDIERRIDDLRRRLDTEPNE